MMGSKIETEGDFEIWNFAQNHCRVELKGSTKYVAMTGSEVTKQLILPFPHRIVKMLFRHTDSSNDAAVTPFNVQIRRDAGAIHNLPLMKEILIDQPNMIDSEVTITFGDGFEYENSMLTIALLGDSTHRIHVLMYVQRLSGGKA